MTRLVCTGDNHVGKGSHLYAGRLDEQERVWRDTLRLARDLEAAAVLHAGDLFDKRRPSPAELLAVMRPLLDHLMAGGCAVHAIPGNHDSTAFGAGGLEVLAEAGLVELYDRPTVFDAGDFNVAALPWSPAGRLIAERGGRDGVTDDVVELLVKIAGELAEVRTHGWPMVLLGHWSAAGAHLPTGLPVEQLREPVLPTGDLEALGFDAIVLGHIHVGDVFGDRSLYVGPPMALDHGEAGLIHGVWSLHDDPLEGALELSPRVGLQAHPIKSTPFVTIPLAEVARAPVDGAIVRVRDTVSAETRVDVAAVREQLAARGARRVDVQLVVERATRPNAEAVDTDRRPAELLGDYLTERGIDEDRVERLLELGDSYLAGERVPADARGRA